MMLRPTDFALLSIMPSVQAFKRTVKESIFTTRITVIRTPSPSRDSALHWYAQGVLEAGLDGVIKIVIGAGGDVEGQVGQHIAGAPVPADKLARLQEGGLRVFALTPDCDAAAAHIDTYVASFGIACAAAAGGTVRLVCQAPEGTLGADARNAVVQRISYESFLTAEEISAYVRVRMIGRPGPGNTGLIRSLVEEFSGGDPFFAEELMSLSDDRILELPETIRGLPSAKNLSWQPPSWDSGTLQISSAGMLVHPRITWLRSKALGLEGDEAKEMLHRMYWRASVTSLLPWLEGARALVIAGLTAQLESYKARCGGVLMRKVGTGEAPTEIDELDFGNIYGYYKANAFSQLTPKEEYLIRLAAKASRVRNAIAHHELPSVPLLLDLVGDVGKL